jgi:hypothetical protein
VTWMNGAEVEEAAERFDAEDTPNLFRGARILERLMDWTDSNSDGWPYWQKPANAANKLMDLIHAANRFDPQDITEAQLKAALSPIKAFLTKHGVEHSKVLDPPPPAPPAPVEVTVYLSGDNDGPDLLGLVYDSADDALESARENDSTAWSVKAMLYPASAVRLESDGED